jgi:hypothetical protein
VRSRQRMAERTTDPGWEAAYPGEEGLAQLNEMAGAELIRLGRRQLRATQCVGVLRTGQTPLQILPKNGEPSRRVWACRKAGGDNEDTSTYTFAPFVVQTGRPIRLPGQESGRCSFEHRPQATRSMGPASVLLRLQLLRAARASSHGPRGTGCGSARRSVRACQR